MKFIHNDPRLKDRRRKLRNESTYEEAILWNYLRGRRTGKKFRRQFSIGPYIADFYCHELKLVIEIDGKDHEMKKDYDRERDLFLIGQEYSVLRFSNEAIRANLLEVTERIQEKILTLSKRNVSPS